MVNKVILVGNVGNLIDIRHTPGGVAVKNFSVATNESYKDKNGEMQQKTEWHSIVVFSKLAEVCEEYLTKGKQVYLEGKLQTRSWEDRDGNKRSSTEILASSVQFLGSRSSSDNRSEASARSGASQSSGHGEDHGFQEEDIPF